MNHGYSLLELLIALALFGVALQIGALSVQIYIHTESSITSEFNRTQLIFEAWEKYISSQKIRTQ